jgi:hypothetical protein
MSNGNLLTNTFRIPFLEHLTVPYRLVRFDGVFVDDAEYDKNVQLLATTLGRETGGPVALVNDGSEDENVLAVAVTERALPDRVNLCGTVARLRPESDVLTLRFCGGNAYEQNIAKKFLRWALRGSFYNDPRFWEHYGLMTERQPLALNGYDGPVDVYRAFGYGLVPSLSGALELSVDVSFCYLARHSLQECSERTELGRQKFARCLYKYGMEWYLVEVSGPARRLSEIEIPDPRTGRARGVLPFIQDRWARERIREIEELQGEDWALHYKDGKNQRRWAADPLLHRVYSSQDIVSTLKTDKWNALRAPGLGSYIRTAFDKQYVLLPASLSPSIAADFITSVKEVLADVYPESYDPELVVYDDSARTLAKQLQAMSGAIGHRRGYVLQVLPTHAHPKLYTFLKRKQAEVGIHSQCVRQEKIASFYREVTAGKWEVLLTSRRISFLSQVLRFRDTRGQSQMALAVGRSDVTLSRLHRHRCVQGDSGLYVHLS